jgi:hypothetical protein
VWWNGKSVCASWWMDIGQTSWTGCSNTTKYKNWTSSWVIIGDLLICSAQSLFHSVSDCPPVCMPPCLQFQIVPGCGFNQVMIYYRTAYSWLFIIWSIMQVYHTHRITSKNIFNISSIIQPRLIKMLPWPAWDENLD